MLLVPCRFISNKQFDCQPVKEVLVGFYNLKGKIEPVCHPGYVRLAHLV